MTSMRVLAVLTTAYLAAVCALFIGGDGIAAAYLTKPSWFLVARLGFQTATGSTADIALTSWTGNLPLLLASAALNITCVYLLARVSRALGLIVRPIDSLLNTRTDIDTGFPGIHEVDERDRRLPFVLVVPNLLAAPVDSVVRHEHLV